MYAGTSEPVHEGEDCHVWPMIAWLRFETPCGCAFVSLSMFRWDWRGGGGAL